MVNPTPAKPQEWQNRFESGFPDVPNATDHKKYTLSRFHDYLKSDLVGFKLAEQSFSRRISPDSRRMTS